MNAGGFESAEECSVLVRRHQVCYDIWPEQAIVKGERRQIGFRLELVGTHETGTVGVQAGCSRCQEVYGALRRIAIQVIPKDHRPTIHSIEAFDQSIHHSPARHNRPDVSLAVSIVHQQDINAPVDACQMRCLNEIRRALRHLGACEGEWRAPGSKAP